MTVEELIAELRKLDPQMPVKIYQSFTGRSESLDCVTVIDDDVILE